MKFLAGYDDNPFVSLNRFSLIVAAAFFVPFAVVLAPRDRSYSFGGEWGLCALHYLFRPAGAGAFPLQYVSRWAKVEEGLLWASLGPRARRTQKREPAAAGCRISDPEILKHTPTTRPLDTDRPTTHMIKRVGFYRSAESHCKKTSVTRDDR